MDNLVHFLSDDSKTPKQNIDNFIGFSKKLSELNEDITFEENYWKGEVNFVKVGVSSKNRDPENVLHDSILNFAKAYVKYQKINSKLKTQDTILAVRAIEQVCISKYGLVDLTKLIIADFDLAAEKVKGNYTASSAYTVGRHLNIWWCFKKYADIK